MTITLPPELAQGLLTRAQQRHLPVEELVREALAWYLQFEPATLDELAPWQELRDEAIACVEEPHN